jgi:predicted TPR repeat methyltransferase
MATIPEALAIALVHHQAGRLPEAAEIYRRILEVDPGEADALHLLGVVAYQGAEHARAIDLIGKALAVKPNAAVFHLDLGNCLKDVGKLSEAIDRYRCALCLQPDYADAHNNLGNALMDIGRLDEAIACYRRAAELKPDFAEPHINLGTAFMNQGNRQEALASCRRALELNADSAEAHNNLGLLLHREGNFAEAAVHYAAVLRVRPGDSVALHMVAALTGSSAPPHALPDYVTSLFDGYAGNFDEHLLNTLHYRGPQLLREALKDVVKLGGLDILDLGCGTGLCGTVFREWARQLVGVDLSGRMLTRARQRAIYDQLIHGDLLIPLAGDRTFDLVVASDVFDYVGDLAAVFTATARAIRPGGHLAFWVEIAPGLEQGFKLLPSGRFAHSSAYLRDLANRNGFIEIGTTGAVARTDRLGDIQCLVVVLQATGARREHRRNAVAAPPDN